MFLAQSAKCWSHQAAPKDALAQPFYAAGIKEAGSAKG